VTVSTSEDMALRCFVQTCTDHI